MVHLFNKRVVVTGGYGVECEPRLLNAEQMEKILGLGKHGLGAV